MSDTQYLEKVFWTKWDNCVKKKTLSTHCVQTWKWKNKPIYDLNTSKNTNFINTFSKKWPKMKPLSAFSVIVNHATLIKKYPKKKIFLFCKTT